MWIPIELLQPAKSDDCCFEATSSTNRTKSDDSVVKLHHLQTAVKVMTVLSFYIIFRP